MLRITSPDEDRLPRHGAPGLHPSHGTNNSRRTDAIVEEICTLEADNLSIVGRPKREAAMDAVFGKPASNTWR
jgi:hypothetical protein